MKPDTARQKLRDNKCRVSIILVTYNNLQDLPACLSSLHATLGQDDEVIIVDNQSTDGTSRLINDDFPWVRLVVNQNNAGFGAGCNLGAGVAQGKYLAFLNPDTVVTAGWLECLVEALAADPDCGMVTPKILLLKDSQHINACGNDINLSGLTLCRGMGRPSTDFMGNEWVNAVSGAAFVIEKSWFEYLGGFDEDFFLYMEDTDLSLRSRLAGRGCLYVAGSVIYHDYRLTFGPRKVFFQERNRCLMLLKNFRTSTIWLLSPSLLLAEFITWGYVILYDRPNWKNKICAYSWIRNNKRTIDFKHGSLKGLRVVSDYQLLIKHSYGIDFEQTGKGFIKKIMNCIVKPFFHLNKIVLIFFLKHSVK